MGGKIWTKEDEQVLRENYGQMPARQIGILIQRTHTAVKSHAEKLGLKSDFKKMSLITNKKYDHNKDFFSILTEENCYFAGWLAADGNVNQKQSKLQVHIARTDQELLQKFKQAIKFTGNIRQEIVKNQNGKLSDTSMIQIHHAQHICKKLHEHFNIVPKKSLILRRPNIQDIEHIRNYIRGFMDGNGSIYINNGQWRLNFSGALDILTWIKESIINNVVNSSQVNVLPRGLIYNLDFGGNIQVKFILDWLYKNSNSITRLTRKYKLYKKIDFNRKPRGVNLYKNKWRARIKVKQKDIHLGFFDSKIEAYKVYNEAATKYFGERAILNDIERMSICV